jgi:hypothetical protein
MPRSVWLQSAVNAADAVMAERMSERRSSASTTNPEMAIDSATAAVAQETARLLVAGET